MLCAITRLQYNSVMNLYKVLFASNHCFFIHSEYTDKHTLVLSELCNSSFQSSKFRWVTKDDITSAVCCDCCSTPVTSLYCWMRVRGFQHTGPEQNKSGPCFNIKTIFPDVGKYKTVARLSYLNNGNLHTGETTSLYWDAAWVWCCHFIKWLFCPETIVIKTT